MIKFPNAKINIGLNITAKRADGFHNIETVFYPVPLFDVLEIVKNPGLSDINLKTHGLIIDADIQENLIYKAYKILRNDYNFPSPDVALYKKIPSGAGLGGGSSDAAFMLRLLNEEYSLNISTPDMEHYASQLGSDCAFFIKNKAAYAREKGDYLSDIELDLSGYYFVLIVPIVKISTPLAYSKIIPQQSCCFLPDLLSQPVENWKKEVKNDFEPIIFKLYPELAIIKQKLYKAGALYASMSGSGSSVYGLFNEKPANSLLQEYAFGIATQL